MIYGRAGYAWMRTHEKLVDVPVGQPVLDRKRTRDGVLWGVGGEFAVTHHAALRTEFNQTNFRHGLKAARIQIGVALGF
jgi:opacity protein-like surface antigen